MDLTLPQSSGFLCIVIWNALLLVILSCNMCYVLVEPFKQACLHHQPNH
uniref:Uncharacterized protein n=1 Tax=Rhizophora mucronata TaxID=61149 RepID=A0A2P2PNM2_RHIMU